MYSNIVFSLFKIIIFLNGFVFIEPSPADLLFVLLFIIILFNYRTSLYVSHLLITLLLILSSIVPFFTSIIFFIMKIIVF